MYFFTSDEHLGHANIIKYCNRPFNSVQEMDAHLIQCHNRVVSKGDTVVHAGDFTLIKDFRKIKRNYIDKLNGNHIFLKGSHDYWLENDHLVIFQKTIKSQFLVVCHYAMKTWHRSHYNSWQLHGHSHGTLKSEGKQLDIGVDNNNYYPFSFDDILIIMNTLKNNFNYTDRSKG